jgi:hypothetical protein
MQGEFSMLVKFRVLLSAFCAVAVCFVTVNLIVAADPKADKSASADRPGPTPAETNSDSAAKESAPAAKAPEKRVKQLSAEMTERRDKVRRLLASLRSQPFNTQQNTCTDVLEFCRAFGCDTELNDNATSGQKVNGITCLCWNMPCGGYELMTVSEGHLAPRVGYGYQNQSSDLAAVLALSHVPADYPARAGKNVRTVGDLMEYEKLTCRQGLDMSLKLVALAYYVQQPSWKDNLGGEWTLQRVVAEELGRPVGGYPHAATNRLLGLCAAVQRFKSDKIPLDGDLARAKQYIDESIEYAYASQNSDGSWGRPTNRDYSSAVAYTAHMLQWLITALPANRLEDRQIVRAIDCLQSMFNSSHYQSYISMMSAREISAAMHAGYVLNAYDRQVFAPADPPPGAEPAKKEKPSPASASRSAQPR